MRPSRAGIVEDMGRVSAELREKLRNCQSDASFLYAASYQLSAFSFADLESQAANEAYAPTGTCMIACALNYCD